MTTQTARRKALLLGHSLGPFKTQRDSRGAEMYRAAWCLRCGDVCFAAESVLHGGPNPVNPALQNHCSGSGYVGTYPK